MSRSFSFPNQLSTNACDSIASSVRQRHSSGQPTISRVQQSIEFSD